MQFRSLIRKWWKSVSWCASSRGGRRDPKPRSRPLVLELLETRLNPSAYNWVGGSGGDWDTLANWQVAGVPATVLPGPGDDVNFGTFSGNVKHAGSASDTVNSLTGPLATLQLSAGSLALASAAKDSMLANFTQSGGTLGGAGTLIVSGNLSWSGGTMAGTGTTVADGTLNISNIFGPVQLNQRTLTNAGTASFGGINELQLGNGAVIDNLQSATFYAGSIMSNSISGSATFNNHGTILHDGGSFGSNIDAVLSPTGNIEIDNTSLTLNQGSVSIDGSNFLYSSPASTLTLVGNILGNTTSPSHFNPQGTVSFDDSASHQVEAMSNDLGAVGAGFINNFSYGAWYLEGASVSLVDNAHNSPGSTPEAIYVDSLDLVGFYQHPCVLNLNGLHLYTRSFISTGGLNSVQNGTVTVVPDGGPIAPQIPTPGNLTSAGQQDDWTFTGQAGQTVNVTVATGTGSTPAPTSPALGIATVSVVDSNNHVLASVANTVSGQPAVLQNVSLPSDGTYHLVVQGNGSTTGNYLVTLSPTFTTRATPSLSVTAAGAAYNGLIHPATATVAGSDGIVHANLEGVTPTLLYYTGSATTGTGSSTAPTAAGTYTVVASFAGSTNYTSASAQATFTIATATPAVTVTDLGGHANGSSFPATATLTGVYGLAGSSLEGVAPTFLYYAGSSPTGTGSSTAPSAAGTYTVVATFPGSTDYTAASNSTTFVITETQPTVSVTDAGGAYNGSPHAATAQVAGTNGVLGPTLEGVAPTVLYYVGSTASGTGSATAPSTPGTYTAVATFPGTADYASASSSVTFTITQLTPTVHVTDAGGTFTANPFTAIATVTGINGVPGSSLENVTPSLLYYVGSTAGGTGTATAPTSAGTYTVVATFPGSADYTTASGSATFTISQTTPEVSSSDAGGTFSGNPFPATATVTGVSGAAASSLEGVTPALLYYPGSTASGTGSATAPKAAGTYTVVASFPGSADYGPASAMTTFTVNPAAPTIAVTDGGGTFNGQAFPATATVAGVVSGADDTPASSLEGVGLSVTYYAGSTASGTPLSGAPTQAGTYTVVASFPGSADYSSANASTTFTISVASPTVAVTDAGGTFNGQPFPATATVAGVVPGVDNTPSANLEGTGLSPTYYAGSTATDTPLSGAPAAAGTYTVVASFPGSADYAPGSAMTTFLINRAALTITANSDTKSYGRLETFSDTAFTQTGLVTANGDNITGVTETSTGAAVTAPVGTYPIVASSAVGTGLSNYTISYVSGTLTVNLPALDSNGPLPAHMSTVALELATSSEHNADFVLGCYQNCLGRTLSTTEVNSWVADLQGGMSDQAVQAGFLSSPEYLGEHGGAGSGWVQSLYQVVLGRTPAAAEVAAWLQLLNTGATPQQVAYAVASSYEQAYDLVAAAYQKNLGRTGSLAEINDWVRDLQAGERNESVLAAFVGSLEYWSYFGNSASTWLDQTYEDLFGRPADGGADAAWLPVLQSGP
jgi:hypothetical protein